MQLVFPWLPESTWMQWQRYVKSAQAVNALEMATENAEQKDNE